MKKIYSLVFILLCAIGASAQSTDLQLIHLNMKNGDTIKYNSPQPITLRIVRWGFKNNGPTALVQATDTIILAKAYTTNGSNRLRLSLPANGVPVGDTVYFTDTVGFTSAPSTNPFNWCDTATVFRSGTLMTDPTPANNQQCASIRFVQDPLSVGTVTNTINGVSIYPNPASNNVTIAYNLLSNANEATLTVRSILGQVVNQQSLSTTAGKQTANVDLANISAGIYIAEINIDGEKSVSRFSVNK